MHVRTLIVARQNIIPLHADGSSLMNVMRERDFILHVTLNFAESS